MKKKLILWTLAAVNAALLLSLSIRLTGDNLARGQAQPQPASRRPADYIMIPGNVPSSSLGVVYLIDTTNGLLGAMAYNDSLRQLDTMAPVDLNRVFNGGAPAAPQRPMKR